MLLLVSVFCSHIALAQEQAALVSVDKVISHSYRQTVPVIGQLVARHSGTVATRVSGMVSEVLIQIGDQVEKGQVIARLDNAQLSLQQDIAQAQFQEARTRLKTARAQLALAGQEVKRLGALQNSAAVSKASYDDARQQQNIAFARVSEAEAAIATSQSLLSLRQLDLDYAEIKAPYDGTITTRLTESGSYLSLGDPVVRLISDQQMEIEANIPYDKLDGLVAGAVVDLILDNNSRHQASVRAIIPEENPRTRTRRVRFDPTWSESTGRLAAEQSATLLVPVSESRQILSVHKDAVIRKGEKSVVFIITGEITEQRDIELAGAVGERFEIINGLKQGDVVVIRGNERLRPGQAVTIKQP